MKYYKETGSLSIDLSEIPSAGSKGVSEGIVLDYDANGNLVGIDIDNPTSKVALEKLVVSSLPGTVGAGA